MVEMKIEGRTLLVEPQGLHRLWAFRRRVEVPLSGIRSIDRPDATIARGWWKGLRVPGTHIPNVIIAGTFYHRGRKVFWDVRNAGKAVHICCDAGGHYDELIVEVADPAATVVWLRTVLENARD